MCKLALKHLEMLPCVVEMYREEKTDLHTVPRMRATVSELSLKLNKLLVCNRW